MQTSRKVTENLSQHLFRVFPDVDVHTMAAIINTIMDWHNVNQPLAYTGEVLFFKQETVVETDVHTD